MEHPVIKDKLSWEKIHSFPIKHKDMTVAEMRELVVSFFRYAKTALWTPDSDFYYIRNAKGKEDEMLKGTVYGGLPYIGIASGNIYRLMDYMDEETGVVDMAGITRNPKLFGNQCSIGSYWGWARVINSAKHDWTGNMVVSNGFLRVGPYTYDDKLENITSPNANSVAICEANGKQVMFQSYAQLQPGDGLVYYTTAGHVVMCSCQAHVEYIEGTDQIDGENSYITIIHQAQKWLEGTGESGDAYLYKSGVDEKQTFEKLFSSHYLPFTFAEFQGTHPIEETKCTFSIPENHVTVTRLFTGIVTSNYGISDVYAVVRDGQGKEIYRHAVRAVQANVRQQQFVRNEPNACSWGELNLEPDGEYTVEITVQLGTGERHTVYQGKLVP